MAEVDELYSVKTAYWLGNYEVSTPPLRSQHCHTTDSALRERERPNLID